MAKSYAGAVRQVAFTIPVTPSDSEDLPRGLTRALFVSVPGDVAVTYANGLEDVLPLAEGIFHPLEVVRVRSTGTDATGIKACY